MKKLLYIVLLLSCFQLSANLKSGLVFDNKSNPNDTITKNKRKLTRDLNAKYTGRKFEYKEDATPKKKPVKLNSGPLTFFSKLAVLFGNIFPYLLAIAIIFILVKSFILGDTDFWKLKKNSSIDNAKLEIELDNDDLNKNDFENLVQLAKSNGNYSLAIRYYYLLVLQKMDLIDLISYHKDKTNEAYLFELKSQEHRKTFSYLSYLYNYVWYGKFSIDSSKFTAMENSYKNFIKTL